MTTYRVTNRETGDASDITAEDHAWAASTYLRTHGMGHRSLSVQRVTGTNGLSGIYQGYHRVGRGGALTSHGPNLHVREL